MLTKIAIENFKGISERVELELSPITLLFGANSAGKSSVIHALHYAREVLLKGNLDADVTETGGDYVRLGGFKQFLHGRKYKSEGEIDERNQVKIRLTCALDEQKTYSLTDLLHADRIEEVGFAYTTEHYSRDLPDDLKNWLVDAYEKSVLKQAPAEWCGINFWITLESVGVEFAIQWDEHGFPVLGNFQVLANDEPILELAFSEYEPEVDWHNMIIKAINWSHPSMIYMYHKGNRSQKPSAHFS